MRIRAFLLFYLFLAGAGTAYSQKKKPPKQKKPTQATEVLIEEAMPVEQVAPTEEIMEAPVIEEMREVVAEPKAEKFKPNPFTKVTIDPKKFPQPKSALTVESSFYNGLAVAKQNGKYGFVNESGKAIIPIQYESADHFNRELKLLSVTTNGKKDLLRTNGKRFFEKSYDDISYFSDNGLIAVMERGKWGYCNTEGKEVLPLQYDLANTMYNGVAIVKKGALYGLIDKTGKEIVSFQYESLSRFYYSSELYQVKQDGLFGLISKTGEQLVPPKYDDLGALYGNNYLVVVKDKKYGIYSLSGKTELITLQYSRIEQLSPHYLKVSIGSSYGILDVKGKTIVEPKYDELGSLEQGLIVAKLLDKYGYITVSGKTILPFIYDKAEAFQSSGLAQVRINGKYGLIDEGGQVYLAAEYDELTSSGYYREQNYIARQGKLYGIVSPSGEVIVPIEYNEIKKNGKFFISRKENDWFLLNELGKIINTEPYQSLRQLDYQSRFAFEQEGLYGLYDAEIGEIIPPMYTNIETFNDKYIVRVKYTYGLADKKGKLIMPVEYEQIASLSDTLLKFKKNSLWGVATFDGKILIPPTYHELSTFNLSNFLTVSKGGLVGVITPTGQTIVEPQFDELGYFSSTMQSATFRFKGKWGALNTRGEVIAPPIYEEIRQKEMSLYAVRQNGLWGFLDKNGKAVLLFNYSEVYYSYRTGLLRVNLNGKKVYINITGEVVEEAKD